MKLDGPVAFDRVQVGVADPAGFNLYQQFARTRARHRDFFDCQGLAECSCNRCFHGFIHHCLRSLIKIPYARTWTLSRP
jgi:hypothetical protein